MANRGTPVLMFLAGMLVGAVMAVLYAPASGEEVRDELRRERDRALEELDRVSKDLRETVAETRAELAGYVAQLKEREGKGAKA